MRVCPCCRSFSTSDSPYLRTALITCFLVCARRLSSNSLAKTSMCCALSQRTRGAFFAGIDGLADLQVEKQVRIPQLEIIVDARGLRSMACSPRP